MPPNSPFEFQQQVHRAGYCYIRNRGGSDKWLKSSKAEIATPEQVWFDLGWYYGGAGKPVDQEYLIATRPIDSPEDSKIVKDVADYPGLFLEFANTPLTADGLLGFANKWGFLRWNQFGSAHPDLRSVRDLIVPVDDGVYYDALGEYLFLWIDSIHAIRREWSVWEHLRGRDESVLKDLIEWRADGEVRCRGIVVASPDYKVERLAQMEPGDVLQPVRYYLEDAFTNWNPWAQAGVSTHLVWDRERARWRVKFVPATLIGALWYQFATALSGESEFRQCSECALWLEIAPGYGRPDKSYCSDACRMRAYRRRKSKKAAASRKTISG